MRTYLWNVSDDIWQTLSEWIGMHGILRLWSAGSSTLTTALQRVVFRRLVCNTIRTERLKAGTVGELRPFFLFFEKMRALELELVLQKPSPELLFLASRMVAKPSQRTEINYDIGKEELEAIPWMNRLENYHSVTFMNASPLLVDDTPLPFCSPSDGSFAQVSAATLLLGSGHTSRAVTRHCIRYERPDGEIALRYPFGTDLNFNAYPTNLILSGLMTMREMHLVEETLLGEWKFDFTSLPNLVSFRFDFSSAVFKRFQNAITILGTENLTTLILNHRIRSQEAFDTFMLDTTGVPNIRHLELTHVVWSIYSRMHWSQLSTSLEYLHLSYCIIGDDAWNLRFPPNLKHLRLESIFTAVEPEVKYEDWVLAHLMGVKGYLHKTATINPLLLPASLETLVFRGPPKNESSPPFNPDEDIIADWNLDTEQYIRTRRHSDWSILTGYEIFPSKTAVSLTLNGATMQEGTALRNLKVLRTDKDSNIDRSALPPNLVFYPS